MMLQRDLPAPIWGWSTPGATITVQFGEKTATTVAEESGRWEVTLHGLQANKTAQSLDVSSTTGESLIILDILVGEIWLASGQTNMEWKVSDCHSSDQEIPKSDTFPELRLLKIPHKTSYDPPKNIHCTWQVATPEQSLRFSAVAWHFAKQVNEKLDVPIGIIQSSWSGSRIEPWINDIGYKKTPTLHKFHRARQARTPGTPEYQKAGQHYLNKLKEYTNLYTEHLQNATIRPDPPVPPKTMSLGNQTIGIYPAMIESILPFSIRGFLWYQGESNIKDGTAYYEKKRALIQGWREAFQRPNAPFYFVQLAPFRYNTSPKRLPEFCSTQQKCLKIQNTEMVVTNDLGDLKSIHPKNKSEIGRRLALLALKKTYSQKGLVRSPLYQSYTVQQNAIIIYFQSGQKLRSRDNKLLTHFEIAAENGSFHPAVATIQPDQTLKLTSKEDKNPIKARFAWHQTAQPNLINQAALPAAAFHTHWPIDPTVDRLVSRNKSYSCSDPNIKGWSTGLTDGSWSEHTNNCFATNDDNNFPKSVTIDLKKIQPVTSVKFGLPPFGSTKTINISLSRNGKDFSEIGHHSFPLKQTYRSHLLRCPATPARFVKFTFPDCYQKEIEFSRNISFLTEAEVYAR